MDHRGLTILKGLLAFAILSTGLHFTHNFVEIDQYPRSELIGNTAIQVGIVASWPVFTAIALVAYRRYARRRDGIAHGLLGAYGAFCLVTLGHFTAGNPDIPAFWYATIFTDVAAGVAILGFVAWSVLAGRAGVGPAAPRGGPAAAP